MIATLFLILCIGWCLNFISLVYCAYVSEMEPGEIIMIGIPMCTIPFCVFGFALCDLYCWFKLWRENK